jgi:V/A-type H+-transporting ATPase subunit I
MIVPMLKYLFVIYHNDYERFLKGLKKVGVVDVDIKEDVTDEELDDRKKEFSKLNSMFKELELLLYDNEDVKGEKIADCAELFAAYSEIKAGIDEHEQHLSELKKELAEVEPWGNFDAKKLKSITENNPGIHFFVASKDNFDELEIKGNVFVIKEDVGIVYFIVVGNADFVKNIEEVNMPERPPEIISEEIFAVENKVKNLKHRLIALSVNVDVVGRELGEIENLINFKKINLSGSAAADDKIRVIEGWIPKRKNNALQNILSDYSVYAEAKQPHPEENVPVLLKNSKFNRLFEQIGELYSLPDYKELDLTPFFAPFYMLFFGYCLGDAGYGLLILVATVIAMFKVKDELKPVFKLGALLGLSTVIMGILSGSFFGINLINAEWEWIKKYQAFMLNNDKLMLLSLALGFVQIVIGMILKAWNKIRMFGAKYAISNFGWIALVLGGAVLFFAKNEGLVDEPAFNKYLSALLIFTGIPILFYNSPEKNIFVNFGMGFWDTYNMASGLLGDLLSYIRLFALGISSAVLGSVFNQLAFELNGSIPVVSQLVTLLILLFGHGLNLFIAGLGSFVHPLRLTFVEFYKNAGFIGGGRKYQPFK